MYIIWYVWPYALPCCCVIIYVYVATGTFRSHCSSRLSKIILSNKYVAISDNIQIFNTTISFFVRVDPPFKLLMILYVLCPEETVTHPPSAATTISSYYDSIWCTLIVIPVVVRRLPP